MLRFTGQRQSPDPLKFTLSHPTGYLDDEIAETLGDALKALLLAIGRARTEHIEVLGDAEKAVREALLGFGILAFNETRAFLIVAGAGLDRHARIHFRSVMEYELRVRRILELPERAINFFDAFAHEIRKTAQDLEVADEVAIENEIVAVLGKSVHQTASEKKALYGKSGDVKSAMSELPAGGKRYVGTFAWPSQVAHGSVLALRDIAKATEGAGSDFMDVAGRDGYGDRLAYIMIWTVLYFANLIAQRLLGGSLQMTEQIIDRTLEINRRLRIVTEEQERRYAEVLKF